MKRVLVAGGAGYVGSHTAKALRAAGFEPVVLDDLSTGYRASVRFGPFVEGRIEDAGLVRRIVAEYEIVGALHFAASAYVRESLEIPEQYFRNNVANSVLFIEALLASGVSSVVFSSSCATYGAQAEGIPLTEDSATLPISPYGESKLIVERILEWYSRLKRLRFVALRYFNASGADAELEIGEAHEPETHIVPLLLRSALGRSAAVTIFGNDFPTPDGTAIRDYVHVTDLADAHVRALRRLLAGEGSRIYNLGSEHGCSISELIRVVEHATNRKVSVTQAPRNPGDPAVLVANAMRARSELGWTPSHSGIDNIIRTALAWETCEARSRFSSRRRFV